MTDCPHFTQRDREAMVLHLKAGDRVRRVGGATCSEMSDDLGTVVSAEQGGPWMSARYEIRWDRSGKVMGYCNGHLVSIEVVTPTAEA